MVRQGLPAAEPIMPSSALKAFVARAVATACFCGHLPLAPGSWGALFALVLAYLFLPAYWLWQLVAILAIFFVGVWSSTEAERFYGHDGRPIAVDEASGMLVVIFLLPKSIGLYAVAFILFRFFDIVKLPPTRRVESLSVGWGIMMDDFLAGVYAFLTMRLLLLLM